MKYRILKTPEGYCPQVYKEYDNPSENHWVTTANDNNTCCYYNPYYRTQDEAYKACKEHFMTHQKEQLEIVSTFELPIKEKPVPTHDAVEKALDAAIKYNQSVEGSLTPEQERIYSIGYLDGKGFYV